MAVRSVNAPNTTARQAVRESVMNHFASLHTKKIFCSLILLIAFTAFTADIFDLREELQIISSPYNSLDNNITTGMTDQFVFDPARILTLSPIHWASSVAIAFAHLPSCGFRAPPFFS
jgi:hypothetical protein